MTTLPFPRIPFYLDVDGFNAVRARYSISMLGLIAGFVPDFKPDDKETAVWYSYEAPQRCALWLPASREAHTFLSVRNVFDPESTNNVTVYGQSILCLFAVESGSKWGDIIAATFFFLSLHEEWSVPERDQFGRFEAGNSLLGKLELLDRPVVAEYAAVLKTQLLEAGFACGKHQRFDSRNSAVCLTHDIDYISKCTPGIFYREVAKYFLLNELQVPFSKRFARLGEYLAICVDRVSDPYRVSAAKMLEMETQFGMQGTWFLKAGGNDKRDVTYRLMHPFVRKMVKRLLKENHEVAIHPSFNAHTNGEMFSSELQKLQSLSGGVVSCRQHYLRFEYPKTWNLQQANGIAIDSTLGFAENEGFRNGTCHPFMPFDLERNCVIPLWEVPLVFMDGTLGMYRGLTASQSSERINQLLRIVQQHQGVVTALFHNTCYDKHDFPGWGETFEQAVRQIDDLSIYSRTVYKTVTNWLCDSNPANTANEIGQIID